MATLKQQVDTSIYKYPSLYRGFFYETSRPHVLDHLFFTIGNGYEWNLATGQLEDPFDPAVIDRLPDGFFDRRLYEIIYLDQEKWAKAKQRPKYYYQPRPDHLVFEADDDKAALYWFRRFERKDRGLSHFVYKARASRDVLHPYGLCKYSALVEILEGHTNNWGCPPHKLTPADDWLEGCIEQARYAFKYYKTPSMYEGNYYYTDNVLRQMEIDERLLKQGEKLHWKLKPGETKHDYAASCWQRHLDTNLEYLTRFLEKYIGAAI